MEFFSKLATAGRRVLFLDYDGTIAPFHVDPAQASPYPEACELLRRILQARDSHVVIVSGRRFEDLERPLALVPHTAAWASDGWERLVAGRLERRAPSEAAQRQLDDARRQADPFAAFGARIESKIASVATHWRGLDEPTIRRIRTPLTEAWTQLAGEDLMLLPFDGGLEIRARGFDKGTAIEEALAMHPAGTACAYLGDDLTDEDAFRAIRGRGLAVLVREEKRETAAELWMPGRAGVLQFLERWRAAVAGA